MVSALHLGVNIDHVATLRQARYRTMLGSPVAEPCPVEAALLAEQAGADSITAHLRADRRHVQDSDMRELQERIATRLNFEMGITPEIVAIAMELVPHSACLVPEQREEVTTEGGLDVIGQLVEVTDTVEKLNSRGIRVSLFVDPIREQIEAAARTGAEMVELHTGSFANATGEGRRTEALRLAGAAEVAHGCGLQVNAGHGLTVANLPDLFGVRHLVELNIGHHIISRAVSVGLLEAIREIRAVMDRYPVGAKLENPPPRHH
jgi:pyridoxine 5-phosphate synthase